MPASLHLSGNGTHTVRSDLGGVMPHGAGTVLAAIAHLSDLHVLDAASPARAEWVELEAHDPHWRPLLHLHRPYDTLTAFALHAHVRAIADDPVGPATGRPFDIAVSSGDNIDNAQRNELEAYLAVLAGGTARLDAHGSAQDARPDLFADVFADVFARVWPYWSPDGTVDDAWRVLGYPVVEDFIARASAPIVSAGIGLPWTSVPGNHDLMRQGTALANEAMDVLAVAPAKSLRAPADFRPADPLAHYLDEPEAYSTGPMFPITADAGRRAIDRREWIQAHVDAGALGYTAAHAQAGGTDAVVDLEHVRLVLLDTNHPGGDYQGSIGVRQLAWLDERLTEVDMHPGRVAVLVSHHGAASLVNERGHDPERRLAGALTDVVHRHPSVVAWLVGHRHINRIEARPGPAGGFWEITTASVIDWPSQTRAVEIVRHADDTIELICTLLDHHDVPDGLGTLHRDLAHRFTTTGVATRMAGRDGDGNVRLLLPPRS